VNMELDVWRLIDRASAHNGKAIIVHEGGACCGN